MTSQRFIATAVLTFSMLPVAASEAASVSQVDDFQSGLQSGWGGGAQEITITTDGGPDGAGDRYLAYTSFGSGSANSRMILPNEANGNQWSGDYTAAGITGIQVDVLNPGDSALNLRLAIANGTTWYASSDPVLIPSQSDWGQVTFVIDDGIMTRVGSGADTLAEVLAGVTRVRILSSVALPSVSFGGSGGAQGDFLVGSIGVDNISAVGVPEPSTLLAAALALGGLLCRRSSLA